MRLPCLVTCFIVASTCVAQSPAPVQPQGRIIGLVVNDLNEPIGSANLCTSVVGAHSSSTSCGQTADRRGHFDISVALDTNRVFADKQDAGYQNASTKPMGYGVPVKLTEAQPVAHVTIKIGPQPAEIDLIVTDKGRAIRSIHSLRVGSESTMGPRTLSRAQRIASSCLRMSMCS